MTYEEKIRSWFWRHIGVGGFGCAAIIAFVGFFLWGPCKGAIRTGQEAIQKRYDEKQERLQQEIDADLAPARAAEVLERIEGERSMENMFLKWSKGPGHPGEAAQIQYIETLEAMSGKSGSTVVTMRSGKTLEIPLPIDQILPKLNRLDLNAP